MAADICSAARQTGPAAPACKFRNKTAFSAPNLHDHGYRSSPIRWLAHRRSRRGGRRPLRFVTILYGAPTEHVWHAIYGAVEFYAAGMLLLVLITGPLIAWVLHRGLEPLRQLATLAGNVTADSWEFFPPASARETAELAPLTRALENALHRLERSFNQQRTFVSDAAHELKTAVAVVKSSLQLVACASARQRNTRPETSAPLPTPSASKNSSPRCSPWLAWKRRRSVNERCDLNACVSKTIAELEIICSHSPGRNPVQLPSTVHRPAHRGRLLPGRLKSAMNAIQHSPPQSQVQLRATLKTARSNSPFTIRAKASILQPCRMSSNASIAAILRAPAPPAAQVSASPSVRLQSKKPAAPLQSQANRAGNIRNGTAANGLVGAVAACLISNSLYSSPADAFATRCVKVAAVVAGPPSGKAIVSAIAAQFLPADEMN